MAVREFALPDLGEGLTESELVAWRVDVGDTVELNQVIAEVETAKALVELPSPFAGVVERLFAEPGATVAVGAPLLAFEVDDGAVRAGDNGVQPAGDAPTDAAGQPVEADRSEPDRQPAASARPEREPVLVGYGAPVEGTGRPKRRARAMGSNGPEGADDARSLRRERSDRLEGNQAIHETPRSTPPVRKLAHDLGVDLARIAGTGPEGVITRADVEGAARSGPVTSASQGAPRAASAEEHGETRIPIHGVRKHTAAAMVASAFTAPHASEFLTIDVTPTMELIASLKESPAFRGIRLNLLAVVSKALCLAVARTPAVNSRWDEAAQEIVQFHHVNLGIATATPRGLMVPNIKGADGLDLAGIATALGELVETARAGKSSPADLAGGTISITNIGVFGIDAGTPILNPGEAMILALGAVKRMPWEHHDTIALRQVLTLSISFDHRLVDGEQASRFLADIGMILADPARVLTMV